MKSESSKNFILKHFKMTLLAVSGIVLILLIITYGILSLPSVSEHTFMKLVKYRTSNFLQNKVLHCRGGWLFFEPELTYLTSPIFPENHQSIVAFDSILRSHEMILYVVPIPNKIEIYPEKFSLLPAPDPVKKERDVFIKDLRNSGVRVIDILPSFRSAKRKTAVFDPYDTHWTSLGIELAGKVIAAAIDSALIAKNLPKSTTYSAHDTVFWMYADMRERSCGKGKSKPYSLPIRQVVCENDSLYTDDKNSSVMILGDSFVDRGRWWFAHLGAHIARFSGYPTSTWFSLKANGEGPHMYTHKPTMFPENGIVIWAFTSRVLQYKLMKP